jgi:RND superfamily putative drug exporter
MFKGLARLVSKRYKAIIVLWILLLIPAVYFAPQATNVVSYEETQMVPSDLESEVAQKFINSNFPGSGGQATTIIVLTSPDILDNQTKLVVNEISNDLILNKSYPGGPIDTTGNVSVRVDSLYSVLQSYTFTFLAQLHSGYQVARDLTNLTGFMLYGLPLQFQSAWYEVNASAFMLYGPASVHAENWNLINSTTPGPVATTDRAAHNATLLWIYSNPTFAAMNATQQMLVLGWYEAFNTTWTMTASNPVLVANPSLRAQTAIDLAYGPFANQPLISPLVRGFLNLTKASFTLGTWSDFHAQSLMAYGLVKSNLDAMLVSVPASQVILVPTYLDIFYAQWNSSIAPPDPIAFRSMVQNSAIAFSSAIGGTMGQTVLAIYYGLGWDGWSNATSISRVAIGMISQQAQARAWLVAEVAALPSDASVSELFNLANHVVTNSSVRDYPLPILDAIITSFVNSPQNTTMLISISYESSDAKFGQKAVPQVREVVKAIVAGAPGMHYYVTGGDAISLDLETSTMEDISRIDPVTILLVLILIGLFFRSFVASSIPPMVIGVALGMSLAAVFFIGTYIMSVHYSVLALLLTSMMGAGCDYCIFILSRYREERRRGLNKEEAVRTAVTWAGESIATSGATVMIGFGVLSLGRFSMLQSMGISLALGIGVALLAALTLLPSVVMLIGDRVFWPAKMIPGLVKQGETYFTRAAKKSIKHAKLIVVLTLLISIPTTYLAFTLETSYDFIGSMPDTESKQGLSAMSEGFGAGRITPTQVALNMSVPVYANGNFSIEALNSIENISSELAGLTNVKVLTSPTRPLGQLITYANLSSYPANQQLEYKGLMLQMLGANNTRAVLISIIFVGEPFAKVSIDSIQQIRAICHQFNEQDAVVTGAFVAGGTASMYDISNLVQGDFNYMEIVVIIGIYIVLMIVLGSIISPLRSILTILLSISWTLATTIVLFQYVLNVSVLWMIPMVLLVMCLGLGMDYDIFITTRIREEAQKGRETNDAIVHAMRNTGGVITACGVIMAGAFGTLLLSQGSLLREFGFALMFAILLDATIVRIYLVPAIVSLLGKWNWWAPGRLQRVGREEKLRLKEARKKG